MDKLTAQELARELFENNFNRGCFLKFVMELFHLDNTVDSKKLRTAEQVQFKEKFKEKVKSFERLTKFGVNHHDKAVIVVYLKDESSLDRARSFQREFSRWYMLIYSGCNPKSMLLAAFVAPSGAWRLSLVKTVYEFDEAKGFDELTTPIKRWSYRLGKGEKVHTAEERLCKVLAAPEFSISALTEAFNSESVTEEFFARFKGLKDKIKTELEKLIVKDAKIKGEFETKKISPDNFAKKLLSQIIFLYFLQKKGWLGVDKGRLWGEGDKAYLRTLFNERGNKNYFNDILEPLFYEALAEKRAEDFYTRFNKRIPFLNGGLFEPVEGYDWSGTNIYLPDTIFSEAVNSSVGESGNGLLDVFDRYNFTVYESEPLEREVAVDPEMLGKVFENLLAEEERKEKGAFYTPIEVVDFICKESLLAYITSRFPKAASEIRPFILYHCDFLEESKTVVQGKFKSYKHRFPNIQNYAVEIDTALKEITICDPAVGSGVFLLAAMAEIVRLRKTLAIFQKEELNHYELKRYCIAHNLYGVDIEKGSIEIAKLRLWLSLIVDEEATEHIEPLPNLDFRLMHGDSLVDFLESSSLKTSHSSYNTEEYSEGLDEFEKEFKRAKDRLFEVSIKAEKEEARTKVASLLRKIIEIRLGKRFNDEGWADFKQENFLWDIMFSEVFSENGGFDLIVSNPPYRGLQKLPAAIKKSYQEQGYAAFDGNGDIYCLFYEKGMNLLKEGGHLA
ncbi:MAG: hypothetical protein LBP51_00935, partial [Deferribacteraceae bacterium]|nr:hypothetical protein [Deferribacteraceae bacterium]